MGLEPIAQPPGKDTFACPYLPSNGPNTKTEARILRTYSDGAFVVKGDSASIVTVLFEKETTAFILRNTSLIVYTSAKAGTSLITLLPSLAIILAAMMGRTAFFAPDTRTVPSSRCPPFIIIFSIYILLQYPISIYQYSFMKIGVPIII